MASKKKYIQTNFQKYINESNIEDFPMSENEFKDFIEELLGDKSSTDIKNELPENIYLEIPENYKNIYQNKMIEFGIYIPQSKNKSLIVDLIEKNFTKFEQVVFNWCDYFIDEIENYSEFYNENMTEYFSPIFIKTIDEITQGRIIERIINGLSDGTATIDTELLNSFNPNVIELIKRHQLNSDATKNVNSSGIAKEMFILE